MTNTAQDREIGVWGRNNSFFQPFFLSNPDSVVSWFLFNDDTPNLPTETINSITAASNTGTYTVRADQKYQGMNYVRASSQDTNFGTSTSFLPDPSVDNLVTLDVLFIPNRVGEAETHPIWCKGDGTVNNSSFCFGMNNVDQPFFTFRLDSGGGDEASGVATATGVTLVEGDLVHMKALYDGEKGDGVLVAIYINEMERSTPDGVFVGPAAPLDGIENTTSFPTLFANDDGDFGEVTVIEAMARRGLFSEQVLEL